LRRLDCLGSVDLCLVEHNGSGGFLRSHDDFSFALRLCVDSLSALVLYNLPITIEQAAVSRRLWNSSAVLEQTRVVCEEQEELRRPSA
jgi:hypothetical protein